MNIEPKTNNEHKAFIAFARSVKALIPKFRLVRKEKSKLMLFLAFIFRPFNKEYLKETTTLGYTTYLPSEDMGTKKGTQALRQHLQYLFDYTKSPIWFVFSYYCLLPFMFTMRSHWEFKAHKHILFMEYEDMGFITDNTMKKIEKTFTSSQYFWMAPFPEYIQAHLDIEKHNIYREDSAIDYYQ